MPTCRHRILVLLLFAARLLYGQSFQKEYAPTNGGLVIPYSAAQRPDGKFLVSHMVNDDSIRLYVTCLEPDGNVAWSTGLRAHPNITGNEGFVEGPIAATSDNGCIVMVSKSYQSQVMQQGWALVKLGPDGAVQWNRQIAGVGLVDDFLERSGTRTFVAARYPPSLHKRYLACLTDDGATLWEKDLSSDLGTVTISNMQALSGQRMLLIVSTQNTNLSAGHLAVLDDAGNIDNLLSLPDFYFLDATEHPDGRLFFLGTVADKVALGVLQAGQIQWAKVLGVPADLYFSGSLTFNNTQDSLFVSFQGKAFEAQRLLMQFNLVGDFSKGHYLPSKEVTANELLETPDGGLAWVSSSPTNPLRAFVFTKTNPDGRLSTCPAGLLCRIGIHDTLLQQLPPTAWATENVAHIIVRQASWQYQTINGSDYCAPLPLFEASMPGIDSTACTGDVLAFQRDSLTTGASAWFFEGGIPHSFHGPTPPGVTFPDAGNFIVQHVLEQAGCHDTAWVNIRIEPKPEVLLPTDTFICPGSSISITAGGAPEWQYLWHDGMTANTREVGAPGVYTVSVTSTGGCSDVESVKISAVDFPQNPLPADTFSCENTPVLIRLTEPAGWEYTWADGYAAPDRLFPTEGTYTLLAESPEGCRLADSVRVEIVECAECYIYFSNIIKPESGDENGFFAPQTGCTLSKFSMRIFDRWGALLFESHDVTQSWDGTFRGKPVQPGVYTFAANGIMRYKEFETPFVRSGTIAVVR